MEAQLKRRILDQAQPLLRSHPKTRVVVWGAGEIGAWLMAELGARGVAFVDSNPTKLGNSIAGRTVHGPSDLESLEFDEVWIAVLSDVDAVAEELRTLGLWEGEGYRRPFPNGKREQVLDQLPRLFEFLGRADLRDRELLEVGFGGQLFLALACLWRGARGVTLTDVSAQTDALAGDRSGWLDFLSVLRERFAEHCLTGKSPAELLDQLSVYPEPVSASELPFPTAAFDGVINTGVMEHVDDPDHAIREFSRVLKGNGQVLAAAIGIHDHRANDPQSPFHPWSFLEYSSEEWKALGSGAYHQNRWRAVDFRRAFERHGFDLRHSESHGDVRFQPSFAREFAEEFRSAYSLQELAELDQDLWASKRADRA